MNWPVTILLVSVAWFIIVLNYELHHDLKLFRAGVDVKHGSKPLRRGLFLLPCMIGFVLCHNWIYGPWYAVLVLICTVIGMVAFIWWLLFDGLYNINRDYGWWFNGAAEGKEDDSRLDIWLRTLTDRQEKVLKIGLAGIFSLIYIITFHG